MTSQDGLIARFSILGTPFELHADERGMAELPLSFDQAFHGSRYTQAPPIRVDARTLRAPLANGAPKRRTPAFVHGIMPYWHFDADVYREQPDDSLYHFPTRRVWWSVDASKRHCTFWYEPGQDTNLVSETLYHLCRSFGLYLRPRGCLLHSSAVALAGRAILFCGHSQAGKTTLFLEALRQSEAMPLANDRVFIPMHGATAVSWPGYINMCEGTILAHPALARAALRYEDDDCTYRTTRYGSTLKSVFHKDVGTKRMYPMRWLSDCLGRGYVETCPIGAIVFPRVLPGVKKLSLTELSPRTDTARVEKLLDESSLDGREEGFLNWHGIEAAAASSLEHVVAQLALNDVRVLELELAPEHLRSAGRLLDQLRDSWAPCL